MRIALVGFRGSGKTTVFNALTGRDAKAGYGSSAEVNLGVIRVPDARLDAISALYSPKKTTHAEITFADIPGTEEGKGLSTTTLATMREQDAFAHVLGCFGESDPVRDRRAFEEETVLADLAVVEKRLERLSKEVGRPGEKELLERVAAGFGEGRPARDLGFGKDELRTLSSFAFLSVKPMLYVLNVAESDAGKPPPDVLEEAIVMSAETEVEIGRLDPEDQAAFLADLGLERSARDRFVRAAYSRLDLVSFFTTGSEDVHAWTIRRGTVARAAAGKVHSDMERGFIRAEVVRAEELLALGSEAKCRETGKLRVEGRDYVVEDGDVIRFRFAV